MKLQLVKPSVAATTGLLLTAPAVYFILIALLKYMFRMAGPFDAAEPFLTSMGASKALGWNINLLLVLGPALAFLLNLSTVLSLDWKRSEDAFHLHLSFGRKVANWVVLLVSGGCMALLFLYALGENCRC